MHLLCLLFILVLASHIISEMDIDVVGEQRIVIKFLWKLGKQKADILRDLQHIYGEHALKQRTVEKWMQLFRQGRESTDDDSRSGRPATSTSGDHVAAVEKILSDNPKVTTRELAETLRVSVGSIVTILHDRLHMSKISSRWVPRLLTTANKEIRSELCLSFMNKFDHDPEDFLQRIVTGDETWLYIYDPEPKQASMQWRPIGSKAPIKPKVEKSQAKVMATVFFDSVGVLLVHYLEPGLTITAARYNDILTSLREAIRVKRRGKLTRGVIFHHDNCPAHRSNLVQQSLHQHRFEILPHPPYSPDLAPADFHLFPKIKKNLKGKHFDNLQMLQDAFEQLLDDQTPDFYHSAFTDWRQRADKCFQLNGDYVEK